MRVRAKVKGSRAMSSAASKAAGRPKTARPHQKVRTAVRVANKTIGRRMSGRMDGSSGSNGMTARKSVRLPGKPWRAYSNSKPMLPAHIVVTPGAGLSNVAAQSARARASRNIIERPNQDFGSSAVRKTFRPINRGMRATNPTRRASRTSRLRATLTILDINFYLLLTI